MHKFIVPEELKNSRLDAFLSQMLSEDFSRTKIKDAIKKGDVTVNKKTVKKPSASLEEGQVVTFSFQAPEAFPDITPEDIPLDILFENDDFLVLSKPPKMCVHPDHAHQSGTLVNALLHHFSEKGLSSLSGSDRPGIVHRLDKDTSGCILVAKNDTMHRYLCECIADRKVTKKYSALVFGKITTEKGTIDAPITRHPHDRKKMCVLDSLNARNALTHFSVEDVFEDPLSTLLDIQIITGRTHQIRVHLESIGHPVVGDNLYGREKENKNFFQNFPLDRIFLHARELSFPLPNGEIFSCIAPFPEDIENTLSVLLDK